MAMPMPNELGNETGPDRRAHEERPSEQPISGTRARRSAPARGSAPVPERTPRLGHDHDPDREATLLMMKVVERVEVARSFAKLAAGILTESAVRASAQLRAAADRTIRGTVEREGGLRSRYDRALRVARAAREAAIHVATHRPDRAPSDAPARARARAPAPPGEGATEPAGPEATTRRP